MSSQLAPEDVFQPVEWLPGVVDCPELAKYDLAVDSTFNICICTRCDEHHRTVDFAHVREHVRDHWLAVNRRLTPRQESTAFFESLCRRYNIQDRALNLIPTPANGSAPIRYLPIYKVWKCTLCEDGDKGQFMISPTDRGRHYRNVHKLKHASRAEWPEREVNAQTFCMANSKSKVYFEVNPARAMLQRQQEEALDEDELGVKPATPEELADAYLSNYTVIGMPNVNADELHFVAPFLMATGFAQHVEKLDPARLKALVEVPGDNDPLRWIYFAAVKCFKADQARLHLQHNVPRLNLMDEGTGPPKKMLTPLQGVTRVDYGKTWGLWVVFLCRLREMNKQPNPYYPIKFTTLQAYWVDRAIAYCSPTTRRGSSTDILYGLADAFWRPQQVNQFKDLATDEYSDATVRFACLMNMYETGTFATPRNACHTLVRLKYLIRHSLFHWSLAYHKDREMDLDG
ncbi:hypothetical protein FRC12_014356 [Ceratobasidium sp. 428]|nr:hypothetical protein FRC12_014356 [Ceratobasidium sp. 428]